MAADFTMLRKIIGSQVQAAASGVRVCGFEYMGYGLNLANTAGGIGQPGRVFIFSSRLNISIVALQLGIPSLVNKRDNSLAKGLCSVRQYFHIVCPFSFS